MALAWGAVAIVFGSLLLWKRAAIARWDIDHQVDGMRANRLLNPHRRDEMVRVLDAEGSRRFQLLGITLGGLVMVVAGFVALVTHLA
jgi:hypothetical protein